METIGLIGRACILLISAKAALADLESWRIPNAWMLIWSTAGFAFEICFFGGVNIADRLIGAAIPVVLLWPFFILHMAGAGDVKLLAVLGIWLMADDILWCLLFSFAAGAAISVIKLLIYKNGIERFAYAGRFFARLPAAGLRLSYDARGAGKARVHAAVFVFIGILMKVMGVY